MTCRLFDLIKQGATVRQLQLVLESETNLECRNDRQETPLMAAMLNIHDPMKREKTLLLFIEYNANVNCQNMRGQTPLMYTCILNLTRELKILLNEPRLQCNVQDFEGNTAMMYACAMGKTEAVETIVDASCSRQIRLDPYVMNMDATSAFDYARDCQDETMLKLLGRLITDEPLYNYDKQQNDEHRTNPKGKDRCTHRKGKGSKYRRIDQLAGEVRPVTPAADAFNENTVAARRCGEDGHTRTVYFDSESTAESEEMHQSDLKIPKQKSVIMNVHLPKTYEEDVDAVSIDVLSITEIRPTSKNLKCVVDDQIPSTSGFSAYENSTLKTKQRKRKGKRLRRKKRIQSENSKAINMGIGQSKPKDFGKEIVVCNKIYGTDVYPCSAWPDDCYGDVDQMIAKIKRKVTGYMKPASSIEDLEEKINKSKHTGKMNCLKLSASERAKILSRAIWSIYGAPLPPIPITVETVQRVMSGITKLQQYLGKAKYKPGRLLSLDPEMWCIVESIKYESNLSDLSVAQHQH